MMNRILFIRHPSYLLTEEMILRAENKKEGAKTYGEIDANGWKEVTQLVTYLKGMKERFKLFCSPAIRASSMGTKIAEIFSVENKKLDFLAEIPFFSDSDDETFSSLFTRAQLSGKSMERLFLEENPEKIIGKINRFLLIVKREMGKLEKLQGLNIFLSHQSKIAVIIWFLQERRDEIVREDLASIVDIAQEISYVSISEILFQDRWKIGNIGVTSHLS